MPPHAPVAARQTHGPSLLVICGALVLALVVSPFDQLLSDLCSFGGAWHTAAQPIVLALNWIGPPALVLMLIALLPSGKPRWLGVLSLGVVVGLGCVYWLALPEAVRNQPVARAVASALPWALVITLFALFANGKRMAAGFLAPILLSTLVTHVGKWTIGRARPEAELGPWFFSPFHDGSGKLESFPSGHSSAVACVAALIACYFPRARWAFYVFALAAGFERVIHDKHYPSDVLAGFAVGMAAVAVFVRVLGPTFYQRDPAAVTPPTSD